MASLPRWHKRTGWEQDEKKINRQLAKPWSPEEWLLKQRVYTLTVCELIIITTSGQSNLTKRLHHRCRWRLNHIHQVAPQLANTIEVVLPSAHLSPQPKWQIDRLGFYTAHGRKSLYLTMGALLPLIAPTHGGSGPHNTWFPWPTWVLNPNGIHIGSSVFAGLTSVTDQPTDHATRSVTIGRIYVRSRGDTA